jgi:hypothetical protein
MFVLDQNHSELTERHTRQRFRRRGGLSKRSDVERLSQTAITAVRKDTAAHVSLPSQLVKEQSASGNDRTQPEDRLIALVVQGSSKPTDSAQSRMNLI